MILAWAKDTHSDLFPQGKLDSICLAFLSSVVSSLKKLQISPNIVVASGAQNLFHDENLYRESKSGSRDYRQLKPLER